MVQKISTMEAVRTRVAALARSRCGKSTYAFLCEECNPPFVLNCPCLVWWVFASLGLSMPPIGPTLFVNLLYLGKPCRFQDTQLGDIIFSRSSASRYLFYDGDRGAGGVNHVGILINRERVIHASSRCGGVVCEEIELFLENEVSSARGVYSFF